MKFNMKSRRTRFLGTGLMHKHQEVYFLDQFLFLEKFNKIIELGTMGGTLTVLFGIHALRTDASVITFDVRKEPVKGIYSKLKPLLPITHYCKNVFSEEVRSIIVDFMNEGRVLLYCDNGKKKDEFNAYSQYLKVGDVIMAHDRPHEIKYKDIEHAVEQYNLEPYYEDEISELKCRQFCFIKVE